MRNREGYMDPTAYHAINGVRWEELQRLREEEHGIKRGETATLALAGADGGMETLPGKVKVKILELYQHVVLTELPGGQKRSFTYWELEKFQAGQQGKR